MMLFSKIQPPQSLWYPDRQTEMRMWLGINQNSFSDVEVVLNAARWSVKTDMGSSEAQKVAWHTATAKFETQRVALLLPNELGLYDMSGNVAEWCSDWYGYYRRNLPDNSQGPAFGFKRVCRGGSWEQLAISCRVTARHAFYPSFQSPQVGLRLALSATQNQTKRISPRRRFHKTATEGNAQAR